MAKLYFRYGLGKSAELCQTAYNYLQNRNMYVAIINAKDNKKISSKIIINNQSLLTREPNVILDKKSLYEKIYHLNKQKNIHCVLVDNSEYLTKEQAEDLFYISKVLDIPVIAYGNRLLDDHYHSEGACRLMALADDIESINKNNNKRATLDYNYGAMNCSKSSQLLIKNQSLLDEGYQTCLIKPKIDRTEEYITSRIGLSAKADIVVDDNTKLYGLAEYMAKDKINYLLIDEVQFLKPNQIDELKRIVNDYNMSVLTYGLKSDFLSNLFPGSQRLLEVADNIYKMRTVCSCGKGANFNVRMDSDGNYITSGEQIVIDNGDNYDSECAMCFLKHVLKINPKIKSKIKRNI